MAFQQSIRFACTIAIVLLVGGYVLIDYMGFPFHQPIITGKWPSVRTYDISIFMAVHDRATMTEYRTAIDSFICYTEMHGYTLEIVYLNEDPEVNQLCPHQDMMFKRHCAAVLFLSKSHCDWMLFVDADMGVVNPHHRIEEWIDEDVSLIFYDRLYNWEVTAGSYLVKNNNYTKKFLTAWANYEFRLPDSFHGSDNGAIHAVLAEELMPEAVRERFLCQYIWNESEWCNEGLFAFEACVRVMLGARRVWPVKVKLLAKASGWARDHLPIGDNYWSLGNRWAPRDFILHGWKESLQKDVVLSDGTSAMECGWMPFTGPFNMSTCHDPLSWSWKAKMRRSDQEMDEQLTRYIWNAQRNFWREAGRIGRHINAPFIAAALDASKETL